MLFENTVVLEALKARYNAGRDGSIYYMRDKKGVEVDLVVERQRRLSFVEIKSAKTPHDDMAANIRTLRRSTGQGEAAYVVYDGEPWPLADCKGFLNWVRFSLVTSDWSLSGFPLGENRTQGFGVRQ